MSKAQEEFDAGVYLIKSLKTGASYVGASCFLRERFLYHVAAILKGNHSNPRIREAFADHKETDIELRILERCEANRGTDNDPDGMWSYPACWVGRRELLDRETHWIRLMQPSLNRAKVHPKFQIGIPIHEPEPDTAVSAA